MLHLEVSRFIPPSSRINYKRRLAPSHSNTTLSSSQVLLLRRHLPSPSAAFCIPIASTARTALARVGLRNLCSLKVLHGTRAIRFLGSVLMRLLAPRMSTSSTFWWPNVYVLYFLVAERLRRPLLPGGRMSTSSTSRWPYLCSPSEHQDRLDYFPTAICTATTKIGYIEQP